MPLPTPAHFIFRNGLSLAPKQPLSLSGLPVRTNLRAGLAWDDLDDQAQALWQQLTSAVSNTTNALKASVMPGQS